MNTSQSYGTSNKIGLFLGPVLFVLILIMPWGPSGKAGRTAAVAVLMAVWWMTEALPLAATALLPIVLFPTMGVQKLAEVLPPYANKYIFLFMGGFFIAMAMQKWDLHRRIALTIITYLGSRPKQLILGFMVATAFLSMWISNTATTMMMVPIGLGVLSEFSPEGDESDQQVEAGGFALVLMLGIAYAANAGGIATLVGTPPNTVFAGISEGTMEEGISFLGWMKFGLPISIGIFLIIWFYLTRFVLSGVDVSGHIDETYVDEKHEQMGPISRGETTVLVVFLLTALLWMTRSSLSIGQFTLPGWQSFLPYGSAYVHDATVAMAMSLLLFVLPVNWEEGEFALDWEWARRIPWGIILLFGGGFALAGAFEQSELSRWIGSLFGELDASVWVIVPLICLTVTFLTEMTSNTATAQVFLPILATVGAGMNLHPFVLMVPATISASCAFMLPVATPPNAIAFGSGAIPIGRMARIGLVLNLVCSVAIVLMTRVLL